MIARAPGASSGSTMGAAAAGAGVPNAPGSVRVPAGAAPAGRRRGIARDWPDLVSRVVIGTLFLGLAVRLGANAIETGRFTGVLLLISELLVVALTIVRRPALRIDRSLAARVITTLSILGPPLLKPIVVPGLLPDLITAPLSAAGLVIVIAGKLALGRSFGLIPAHRGLVSSGPYRLVRHPIYLGYLITHVAFLAAHPTAWNLAALLTADLALMIRAGYEERILAVDPAYVGYQTRVPWRVVPGVF